MPQVPEDRKRCSIWRDNRYFVGVERLTDEEIDQRRREGFTVYILAAPFGVYDE